MPLLNIDNVAVQFPSQPRAALQNFCLTLQPEESVGLIGESGSGKSTLINTIMGLISGWKGSITFDGHSIPNKHKRSLAFYKAVQLVFQDPYSALHPSFTVFETLLEPLLIHKIPNATKRIQASLEQVGLSMSYKNRYPHQLSGGQRQRLVIARALLLEPKLLLLDEPTSALDVLVQAEILELLRNLQSEKKLTYLFISHDLNIITELCSRIIVLQKGKIIEEITSTNLTKPELLQPYTQLLFQAAYYY